MCVRERKRERVCVCVRERESVCVCGRESESETQTYKEGGRDLPRILLAVREVEHPFPVPQIVHPVPLVAADNKRVYYLR